MLSSRDSSPSFFGAVRASVAHDAEVGGVLLERDEDRPPVECERQVPVAVGQQRVRRLEHATNLDAAIGRVPPCRPHGRSSISNFIYRALDLNLSTGIVMGAAPMTIPIDTYGSSAL